MTQLPDGSDPGVPLRRALADFASGSGARMAALLDRSGGLLAQTGFDRPETAADLASLTAGIHASGQRMGQLTGTGRPGQLVALAGEARVTVHEVPTDGPAVLLLSVFDGEDALDGLGTAVDALSGAIRAPGIGPGASDGLASSLLETVELTFQAG